MLNVRTLPLFSGIHKSEIDALLKYGRIHNCPRGRMLFVHGAPVTHFYVIVNGTFQLFRETLDGHEKTIDVLKAGQTMCESEIMDSSCRSVHRVNGVAVENSVVLEFSVRWLKETAKKHSAFALNLLSSISQQAHLAEEEAERQ